MSIDYTLSDSDLLMTVAEMRTSLATYSRLGQFCSFCFYLTNTGTYRLYLSVPTESEHHVVFLSLARGGVREFKTFESLLAVFRSICDGVDYGLSFIS